MYLISNSVGTALYSPSGTQKQNKAENKNRNTDIKETQKWI